MHTNERQRVSHASGAGRGAPASERVGEVEGRSPSIKNERQRVSHAIRLRRFAASADKAERSRAPASVRAEWSGPCPAAEWSELAGVQGSPAIHRGVGEVEGRSPSIKKERQRVSHAIRLRRFAASADKAERSRAPASVRAEWSGPCPAAEWSELAGVQGSPAIHRGVGGADGAKLPGLR